MKNTTAKLTAATKNKGGVVMKVTSFNNVLTAAVVDAANKMGAYVPAGLKVEMVSGEIVSNHGVLIMKEVFAGKLSSKQGLMFNADLQRAIESTYVEEMVEEVVATEAAEIAIANMPVAPATEAELIAETIAVKTIVKSEAAALKAFKEAKAARLAANKAKLVAVKARRKALKAEFNSRVKAAKVAKEIARLESKGVRIQGMNKTGFLGQARKRALAKDMQVTINTLAVKSDGNYQVGVTTMVENEAIRLGFIQGSKVRARMGENAFIFDNFTKQLILVDFGKDKTVATGMTEFFVWWHGGTTVFAKLVDGVYYDLLTGKAVAPRSTEPRKFEIIGGSPSSLRKDQVLAFDVTNGYKEIDKMLDAVTDGGYSKNKGNKTTKAAMSKYVTRFFAWTAPNTVLGVVENNAIYFGKWANNKLDGMAFVSSKFYATAVSKALNVNFSAEEVEGVCVQCRPYTSKVNAAVVDMDNTFALVSNEAKEVVYIETVTPAIDKELDLAFKGKGKYANCMVVFGKKGCDIQFVSDLNGYKTEFNWGAASNFRVLDITKTVGGSIRNGANTSIQMWETPLANDAEGTLDFLQTLRHEQVESIYNELYVDRKVQVPSLVDLSKNVHTQGVAKQIAPDFVLDRDFSMYKKVHEELFTRINKVDSKFKYAIDGCYNRILSDIACLVVEHGVLQYGEAFIANGEEYFTSQENADRFMAEKHAVRECYGKRIVSMFKYPKMGLREFYKATLIGLDRIVSRVERLVELKDITLKQGQQIIGFYASIKAGTIVVPSVDLLKQQCAGLDFDWDGASIVFDPRFNALLPKSVSITNIVTEDEKPVVEKAPEAAVKNSFVNLVRKAELNPNAGIAISAESLKEAFLAYMTSDNGGWSVGSITNTNTTQIAVLILAKVTRQKRYFKLMKDMLVKWFEHEGGNGEYESLTRRSEDLSSMDKMFAFPEVSNDETSCAGMEATVIDVSPKAVMAAIASMKNADWNNPVNLIKIFEDLNEMFRYYQEITIDSAKTGERVTVSVAPGRKFHALMLNSNKLTWSWARSIDESAEKEIAGEKVMTVKVNDEAPTEKKAPVADKLFELRKEFALDMENFSTALLDAKDVKVALEDVAYLAKFFNNDKYLGGVGNATKSLAAGMVSIKKIYGDLTANYIATLDACDEADEEAIAIAQNKYRKGLQALRVMGRDLTKDMTDVQRGAFAKFIASHRFVTKKVAGQERLTAVADPNGGSTFASSVFAEEYLLYITKHFAEIKFCGEKLSYNEFYQDGDIITLERGIGEYAATTADITGDFVVREFDGKFYATKLIEEVVTAQPVEEALLVRVSDVDSEEAMKEVAAAINKVNKATLFAQSVKTPEGKFEHTYGIFNAKGVKVAGLDAQGKFASIVNGKQGIVEEIYYGTTSVPGSKTTKPYVLVLVK